MLTIYFRHLIILVLNTMERSLTQCEIIPNRIILRNNNYAQRKILINKKFQWLNKYISAASPKIFNPNVLASSSKMNLQQKRNYSINGGTRLQTSHERTLSRDNVLGNRNMNNTELRKTASSQIYPEGNKKTAIVEQNSIAKYFRCKKTRTQFTRKRQCSFQRYKKSRYIQDSQIKPWNIQSINDDDNQCFKQNQHPDTK